MKLFLYVCSFIILISSSNCKTRNSLPDPLEAEWNNKSVCVIKEENKDVRVLQCTFEPGSGHEKHYHNAHYGYTISGSKFQIKDENGIRVLDVKSGSDFYSLGVEWHEVLNIGDSTAVFLIIEPK